MDGTDISPLRIIIKKEACIGCEICVNTCPEVFMEWGLYMRPVFEVRQPERYKALIDKAVEGCPARAISIDGVQLKADGTRG
ncbi:ferredoxin [bacterium]|nr:ferredoxin [bacterium]